MITGPFAPRLRSLLRIASMLILSAGSTLASSAAADDDDRVIVVTSPLGASSLQVTRHESAPPPIAIADRMKIAPTSAPPRPGLDAVDPARGAGTASMRPGRRARRESISPSSRRAAAGSR